MRSGQLHQEKVQARTKSAHRTRRTRHRRKARTEQTTLARDGRWQLGPRAGTFIGIDLDPRANDFCLRWSVEGRAASWAATLGLPTVGPEFEAWKNELRDAVSPPLDAERTVGALGGIVSSRISREFA